jgi:outer membrane protein OmpA-like peptidoglycan-associated protein
MRIAVAIAAALCSLAPAAFAQQSGKVIDQKDVNESALVNMLTPAPVTRSIKVTRDGTPAQTPPPSASLLITFETNSAKLTPAAQKSLEVVGRALKNEKLNDFKFAVEGHADPRGNADANLKLSQQRAESVAAFLAEQQKIEATRLKAVGKGQTELMNVSNPAAPENRRVTIKTLTN